MIHKVHSINGGILNLPKSLIKKGCTLNFHRQVFVSKRNENKCTSALGRNLRQKMDLQWW